jgi:hypothetical protein
MGSTFFGENNDVLLRNVHNQHPSTNDPVTRADREFAATQRELVTQIAQRQWVHQQREWEARNEQMYWLLVHGVPGEGYKHEGALETTTPGRERFPHNRVISGRLGACVVDESLEVLRSDSSRYTVRPVGFA